MSTDYGFRCIDCNLDSIIDNARYGDVSELRKWLTILPELKTVRNAGVRVDADRGFYQFECAIDFAIKHFDAGHQVTVADEYGRVWDQCGARVDCGECGHGTWCTLTEKHDGVHRSKP